MHDGEKRGMTDNDVGDDTLFFAHIMYTVVLIIGQFIQNFADGIEMNVPIYTFLFHRRLS